jgi:UDP-GlcNAc:undecaprenyl-phosphate GlcNAc-1-phosphate transferase
MLWMSSGAEGILAPLIGALCGFLWFNRPRASVFLGDSGSLTIGFLMACAALRTGDRRVVGMAGPLIALALPLADTAWAVARRLWRRKRLFQGDMEHFHHRVLAWVGTPGRALLVLGGFSLGAALLGAAVQTLSPGSNP